MLAAPSIDTRTSPEFVSEPPEGYDTWGHFFRALRAAREASDGSVENAEPYVTGTREVEPETLPRSPKALVKSLVMAGFEVVAITETIVHTPDQFYMSASTEKGAEGSGHQKGDLRAAAKDTAHLSIKAKHPKMPPGRPLAIHAFYEDGKSKGAIIYDPIGIPVELYADYAPSKNERDRLGAARATAIGKQMDLDYNDGTMFPFRKTLVKLARDVNAWLEEWTVLLTKKGGDENEGGSE